MTEKMRLTAHNGRVGKNGAYSARHNDRNFDVTQAEHIDPARSASNFAAHIYSRRDPDMTFDEAEQTYYQNHFGDALDAQNEKHRRTRHPGRVRTMEQYRTSPQTCPEEIIYQIGRKGETIPPDVLRKIIAHHIKWMHEAYPAYAVLDVALHCDEQGAPHCHVRGVWIAHDREGREIVGQSKALQEMGVLPPHPEKKYGKYNNAKMTFTAACRQHLFGVCRDYGLDLEEAPRERSKSGLTLVEYQAQRAEERAREAAREAQEAAQTAREAQNALRGVKDRRTELAATQAQLAAAQSELGEVLDLKARAAEIKKPLFRRDHIVEYHETMLADTRAIGDRAAKRLKEASAKADDVARREAIISQKEKEISPLHAQAVRDAREAQEMKRREKELIKEAAGIELRSFFRDRPEAAAPPTSREKAAIDFIAEMGLADVFDNKERKREAQELARQKKLEKDLARHVMSR